MNSKNTVLLSKNLAISMFLFDKNMVYIEIKHNYCDLP